MSLRSEQLVLKNRRKYLCLVLWIYEFNKEVLVTNLNTAIERKKVEIDEMTVPGGTQKYIFKNPSLSPFYQWKTENWKVCKQQVEFYYYNIRA